MTIEQPGLCPSPIKESKLIKVYFGDFGTGRLQRLPFLGYAALVAAVWFAFVFATVFAIVGAEYALGGNLLEAQRLISKTMGIPYLIIISIVIAALLVGSMNIAAKRARDIGLPGWTSIAVLILLSALLLRFVSVEASHGLNTLAGIGLLLVPGGTIKGKL